MPEWLAIALFVGLPACVPLVGLWLLRRQAGSTSQFAMYRYQFAGQQVALTKGLLFFVLASVFSFWWLEYLLPLPLLPLLLLYFAFVVIRNPLARRQVTVKSESLLTELAAMQGQLNAVNTRVQELVGEIETSQVELDQTRSVKKSLGEEIESKLAEVENWRKLSDEQKQLFIATVGEALQRRTVFGTAGVIVGSIVLNLAATLIWELLGAPGRERLLEWFAQWTGRT